MKWLAWSGRWSYLLVAVFCFGSVLLALYLQHYEFVLPCPLCIFQRIGFIVCGGLALLAALFPWRNFVCPIWPLSIGVAAIAGAGVSIRHIQIQQSLASDSPQSCGAGLDMMWQTQSAPDLIVSVLAGHGDCTVIDWQLGFLTLPMLALAGFLFILAIAVANAAAHRRRARSKF